MKVISFFSFKGGVGRTALLTNLGAYWASRGKVVLLMDLDLAAPGIGYSLPGRVLDDQGRGQGMSELLSTFFESIKEDPKKIDFLPPQHLIREAELTIPGAKDARGHLFFIPAGSRHFAIERLLPVSAGGEAVIPAIPADEPEEGEKPEQTASRALAYYLKEHLESWTVPEGPAKGRGIDYLLIDTRTGFAELLDLSLGYLADKMVLVSALNDQNLKGLQLTLEALKNKRVPVGTFPLLVTVVFSPLPAAEDSELYRRMEKAQQLIIRDMRIDRAGQREIPPRNFPIHYNQLLAYREALLALEQPKSLYTREITDIADHLEGKSDTKYIQDDLIRESRRKALRLISGEKPVPAEETAGVKDDIRDNPALDLPPWYWPLPPADREEKRRDQILKELTPENPDIELNRETFANQLCWSTSLTIAEKQKVLEAAPNLSQRQVDELSEIFEEERVKFMTMIVDGPYAQEILSLFYAHQREWAIFILKDEKAGSLRFLTAPEEHIFPTWERHWQYWLLLCRDTLLFLDDIERAFAMARRAAGIAANAGEAAIRLLELIEYATVSPAILKKVEAFAVKLAPSEPWLSYLMARNRLKEEPPNKEAAKDLLTALLESPPEDAKQCFKLAALVLDDLPEIASGTEKALEKAIALDEKFAYPWNSLGNLLQYHLKRYEEAEAAYRKAIALDEKFAYPWNGLGNLLQEHLKRYEEAEAAYRKAIALDEKYFHPWNGLGTLLTKHLKRYEEAEAAYRKAIALDEKFAYPWNGLGNLLTKHLSRYEEAEAAFRKAIALDEKYAYPWNGLGNLLQSHLKRYEEAEAAYRKAIALDEKDAYPWNGLGLLKREVYCDCKGAAEAFKKGLKISKGSTTAYLKMNAGHLYLLLGDEKPALKYLQEALSEFDKQNHYDANVLRLAVELDDKEKIEKHMPTAEQECKKGDDNSALALILYALVYRPDDIAAYKKQAWASIDNYDSHFDMLKDLYQLAGLRPEVKEQAAKLTAELLAFPQELTGKFKDKARPGSWYDRYRPFAEGKSRGAGDPADINLFCKA
jgi:tetratricopeptide (TPR) repeat protein